MIVHPVWSNFSASMVTLSPTASALTFLVSTSRATALLTEQVTCVPSVNVTPSIVVSCTSMVNSVLSEPQSFATLEILPVKIALFDIRKNLRVNNFYNSILIAFNLDDFLKVSSFM